MKTGVRWLVGLLAVVLLAAFGYAPVRAAQIDDPLLRVLVRKGILTEEEALEIKKEAELEAQKQKEEVAKAAAEKVAKEGLALPKALRGVKFGTLTYLDYTNGYGPFDNGKEEGQSYFTVMRAYFNFKKKINSWLSFRFTPDIHPGNERSYDLRIKYAYAQFKLPDFGFLTDLKMEFGQGHFPWLDFEEHINPYRMQGCMPREFFGTFNSADRGVSIAGNLGGKLDADFVKRLTAHYPIYNHYAGKYGTFWLSYMNGSGYSSEEVNENKAVELRLTLRPFPHSTSGMFPLAGLQFSYFGIYGEGNRAVAGLGDPDYTVNLFMLSYQHPWFMVAAQYSTSTGNNNGKWVVQRPSGKMEELDTELYSIYADFTLPVFNEKLHLYARWDHFDPNDTGDYLDTDYGRIPDSNDEADHYILALAYYLTGKNILMLSAEWVNFDKYYRIGDTGYFNEHWGAYNPSGPINLDDGFRIQTVLQISF
ncbi:hypothetical protein FVE67_06870 [Thermosulfurimonas marina]|uniref:Porin n=1 Tax=Thermosulfurimonas marina TaxID=2047767 RepID=A0A6H1WTK1_9BACT|nr:hypothetical protein [Thermosulfurimonas marina]QJA06533.1 hypothetical protein FVE67_06870 [Thermosulfurimonas marina]